MLNGNEFELKSQDIVDNMKIWSQIAKRFAEYDYHLIFETMNETRLIRTKDEWRVRNSEARDVVNLFNEVAVKAIRKTRKNNVFRPIIIKTIGARYGVEAIEDIKSPNNDRMIILAIHAYEPYYFCMVSDETADWGTVVNKEKLCELLDSVFIATKEKGLPLLIGEFAAINKKNEGTRAEYTSFFVNESKKRCITCILWDNNVASEDEYNDISYAIFNRWDLSWRFPEILRAVIDNSS